MLHWGFYVIFNKVSLLWLRIDNSESEFHPVQEISLKNSNKKKNIVNTTSNFFFLNTLDRLSHLSKAEW